MAESETGDEPRKITVCPDCDSPKIRFRTGNWRGGKQQHVAEDAEDGSDYRCNDCGSIFKVPAKRQARPGSGPGLYGPARLLAEMDPEEVP